jgi:hypothetical protein
MGCHSPYLTDRNRRRSKFVSRLEEVSLAKSVITEFVFQQFGT